MSRQESLVLKIRRHALLADGGRKHKRCRAHSTHRSRQVYMRRGKKRNFSVLSALSAPELLSSVVEHSTALPWFEQFERNCVLSDPKRQLTHLLFHVGLQSPCEGSGTRSFGRFYNTDGWKSCWLTAGHLTVKLVERKNWTVCSISERDLGLGGILPLGPELPIRCRR